MACHSPTEVAQAWVNAGGPSGGTAAIMVAIGTAESGLCDVRQEGQPYGLTGWGVWQITPGDSVPECGTDEALLDLATNACAAVKKYNSQGFEAWTTYVGGQFQAHLGDAQKAIQGLGPPGTGSTTTGPFGGVVGGLQGLQGAVNTISRDVAAGGVLIGGAIIVLVALFLAVRSGRL